MLLKQKTVIVTGASSGIGRAVVLCCVREGARVIASDVDEAGGEETLQLARSERPDSELVFVRADASNPDDHQKLVHTAIERYGALHAACNNAGISGELEPVADLSIAGWKKVIDINLSGVFYGMRAQIPRMLDAGGGAIVNMSSILGQVGTPAAAAYVAAKHGVIGLTQTGPLEYSHRGIRINAVGPGYIDTPLLQNLTPEVRNGLIALHPIGRLGKAEEVAELTIFLLSDRASFITGSYHPVDGGYLAQ